MAFRSDVDPRSGSRLPLLGREELDEDGQKLYDAVVSPNSRTLVGLRGPGGIWLHSPKLGAHTRAVNQYLRYETGLDARLTELAILVTARENDSQFEWSVHEPVALREGVDPALVAAVKHRKPVTKFPARETLIVDVGRQLFGDRKVRAETRSSGRSSAPRSSRATRRRSTRTSSRRQRCFRQRGHAHRGVRGVERPVRPRPVPGRRRAISRG